MHDENLKNKGLLTKTLGQCSIWGWYKGWDGGGGDPTV